MVEAAVGPRVRGRQVGRPKHHREELVRGSESLASRNQHWGWAAGQGGRPGGLGMAPPGEVCPESPQTSYPHLSLEAELGMQQLLLLGTAGA